LPALPVQNIGFATGTCGALAQAVDGHRHDDTERGPQKHTTGDDRIRHLQGDQGGDDLDGEDGRAHTYRLPASMEQRCPHERDQHDDADTRRRLARGEDERQRRSRVGHRREQVTQGAMRAHGSRNAAPVATRRTRLTTAPGVDCRAGGSKQAGLGCHGHHGERQGTFEHSLSTEGRRSGFVTPPGVGICRRPRSLFVSHF
jgi:hypothetical protein